MKLTIMTLPYSDFKPSVKRFIRGSKWSDFWATQINNKLHSVQPTLGCGSLSIRDRRREQLVLCRLRLGHTYITHRYLLAGEDPPVCISCQDNLTQLNTSWSISMSDIDVLMSTTWENCFEQFLPM